MHKALGNHQKWSVFYWAYHPMDPLARRDHGSHPLICRKPMVFRILEWCFTLFYHVFTIHSANAVNEFSLVWNLAPHA